MPYVSPAQLIDGPGCVEEFSQLLGVAELLLIATVNGADRSDWTADEIAAADAALATMNRFIALADGEINARLAKRGYTLPQSPVAFPVLVVWGRAITRYHLNPQRDKTNEDSGRIERDYRDAIKALDLVAAGKITLGADDPLGATSPATSGPEFVKPCRVFDAQSLRDY